MHLSREFLDECLQTCRCGGIPCTSEDHDIVSMSQSSNQSKALQRVSGSKSQAKQQACKHTYASVCTGNKIHYRTHCVELSAVGRRRKSLLCPLQYCRGMWIPIDVKILLTKYEERTISPVTCRPTSLRDCYVIDRGITKTQLLLRSKCVEILGGRREVRSSHLSHYRQTHEESVRYLEVAQARTIHFWQATQGHAFQSPPLKKAVGIGPTQGQIKVRTPKVSGRTRGQIIAGRHQPPSTTFWQKGWILKAPKSGHGLGFYACGIQIGCIEQRHAF